MEAAPTAAAKPAGSLAVGLLDMGFVRLAAQDPRLPLALLSRVMRAIPLAQSLVAERDGRLVGAIVPKVFVLPDKRRCGAIFWLMIAPEARLLTY